MLWLFFTGWGAGGEDVAAWRSRGVVQGRPERVTVSVTRDGGEAWSRVVELTFVDEEPNGPGCGICTEGKAVIQGP